MLIVRRAIFFSVGLLGRIVGFTGVCAAGLTFSEDLTSEGCCPEKIGSRMSIKSDGSTIFFLRSAGLSESVKAQSAGVCSCSVYIACRIRC